MSTSGPANTPTLEGLLPLTDPVNAADTGCAARNGAALEADGYVQEVRRILARFGTSRTIPAGASLFEPADMSRHLYIVESGRIDISLPEDPAGYPLASFHAGAIFLFDFGGHQIASLEAAEETVVIDLPFARLDRLCRQEMDLRLLLRQCHAFDLKSFLDVCYPARSRFRLAHSTQALEERGIGNGSTHGTWNPPRADSRFMIPFTPDPASHYAGKSRPRKRHARRSPVSSARDRGDDGET